MKFPLYSCTDSVNMVSKFNMEDCPGWFLAEKQGGGIQGRKEPAGEVR